MTRYYLRYKLSKKDIKFEQDFISPDKIFPRNLGGRVLYPNDGRDIKFEIQLPS
ncbi:hypothetical protein ES708_26935 [subsurface metagenome]